MRIIEKEKEPDKEKVSKVTKRHISFKTKALKTKHWSNTINRIDWFKTDIPTK